MTGDHPLIGGYRLLTFCDIADDGEVREPMGSDPVGLIIYSGDGCMTAVLMTAGRENFAGGDILAATDQERLTAFTTSSAFAGRWEIEGDEVVHHLEAATFPNWVGTVQRRRFELDGDRLWLYPPRLLMAGKMRRSELSWRRA